VSEFELIVRNQDEVVHFPSTTEDPVSRIPFYHRHTLSPELGLKGTQLEEFVLRPDVSRILDLRRVKLIERSGSVWRDGRDGAIS